MALTADELSKIAHYDPETGDFTWLENLARRKAGTKAPRRRYLQLSIRQKLYYAHRLAWLYAHGEWPVDQIDHINGDPSDNRIANLRVATPSQNSANRPTHRDNKTGLKGVCEIPSGKFMASILESGQTKYLGVFETPAMAHEVFRREEVRIHGEFAWTA
jgi:hypothetical protein